MTLSSANSAPDAVHGTPFSGATASHRSHGFCVDTRLASDPDEQARNLYGWRQTYDQLAPGVFSGSVSELCVAHMTVFCETTSHALRQTCEVGSDAYWFGIPLKNEGPGLIDGHLIADDALAVMRGLDEFELVTPSDYRILGVVVENAELRAHASDVERIHFPDEVLSRQILNIGAAHKARLCKALSLLLSTAQADPRPYSAAVISNVRSSVLSMFFDLASALQPDDLPEGRSKSERYWIVTQARDYILANRDRPVAVPELCRQFHVSRRTLQYCFEKTLDMTPVSFLRAVRLNGVRRDLSTAHAGLAKTVQSVAADWGFWHLSQFAIDYRKLFGKRPSESLREAPAN